MTFDSVARPELLRLWLTSQLSQLHRSSRQVHTVLLPVPAIQLSASFDQHDLCTTEKYWSNFWLVLIMLRHLALHYSQFLLSPCRTWRRDTLSWLKRTRLCMVGGLKRRHAIIAIFSFLFKMTCTADGVIAASKAINRVYNWNWRKEKYYPWPLRINVKNNMRYYNLILA